MTHSRRATRVAALGAAFAVSLSGLALTMPGTAFAAAPAAPSAGSLSPNSSVTAHKNVELTWAPVAGATKYDVQILNDDDDQRATIFSGSTKIARWTAPVSLPNGEYRWRVRATTSAGTSKWSPLATLTRGWENAVTGLAATSGERVPTLTWNPQPDASFYEIEINGKPFTSPQYSRTDSFVCWTAQTTFTPYGVTIGGGVFDRAPGNMSACALGAGSAGVASRTESLIYGDTYYWRVRGRDGTVSTAKTKFIDPPAGCFGTWLDSDITVADGPSGPGSKVVTVPLGETAPSTVPVPDCATWSNQSTFVPASVPWTFGPAAAPTGLNATPLAAAGSTRVSADPTFSWAPVPNALFYRLYVSRDRQIDQSLDFVASTQGTSLTPASGLQLMSTSSYWAVQACSVENSTNTDPEDPRTRKDCGPISLVRSISQVTKNVAAPRSLTAASGYLLATWTTGSARQAPAKSYDVELVNLSTGKAQKVRTDRISSSVGSGTSSYAFPSAALAEGRYSFHVRPVSEAGEVTTWSSASSVVVIDKAAPTVRLSSSSGFLARTAVRLTFSEPVLKVSSSTVGVKSPSGAHVSGTVKHLSGNTYSFTPRSSWTPGSYVQAWTSGATDLVGKKAYTTTGTTQLRAGKTLDSTSSQLKFVTGDSSWKTRTSSSAYGKSYRSTSDKSTTSKRSYVAATVYGTSVTVGVCKSPKSGSVLVYVDGTLRKNLSLYRSYTGCGSTVSVSGLKVGTHSVKVVAKKTHGRGTVSVDRLTVG